MSSSQSITFSPLSKGNHLSTMNRQDGRAIAMLPPEDDDDWDPSKANPTMLAPFFSHSFRLDENDTLPTPKVGNLRKHAVPKNPATKSAPSLLKPPPPPPPRGMGAATDNSIPSVSSTFSIPTLSAGNLSSPFLSSQRKEAESKKPPAKLLLDGSVRRHEMFHLRENLRKNSADSKERDPPLVPRRRTTPSSSSDSLELMLPFHRGLERSASDITNSTSTSYEDAFATNLGNSMMNLMSYSSVHSASASRRRPISTRSLPPEWLEADGDAQPPPPPRRRQFEQPEQNVETRDIAITPPPRPMLELASAEAAPPRRLDPNEQSLTLSTVFDDEVMLPLAHSQRYGSEGLMERSSSIRDNQRSGASAVKSATAATTLGIGGGQRTLADDDVGDHRVLRRICSNGLSSMGLASERRSSRLNTSASNHIQNTSDHDGVTEREAYETHTSRHRQGAPTMPIDNMPMEDTPPSPGVAPTTLTKTMLAQDATNNENESRHLSTEAEDTVVPPSSSTGELGNQQANAGNSYAQRMIRKANEQQDIDDATRRIEELGVEEGDEGHETIANDSPDNTYPAGAVPRQGDIAQSSPQTATVTTSTGTNAANESLPGAFPQEGRAFGAFPAWGRTALRRATTNDTPVNLFDYGSRTNSNGSTQSSSSRYSPFASLTGARSVVRRIASVPVGRRRRPHALSHLPHAVNVTTVDEEAGNDGGDTHSNPDGISQFDEEEENAATWEDQTDQRRRRRRTHRRSSIDSVEATAATLVIPDKIVSEAERNRNRRCLVGTITVTFLSFVLTIALLVFFLLERNSPPSNVAAPGVPELMEVYFPTNGSVSKDICNGINNVTVGEQPAVQCLCGYSGLVGRLSIEQINMFDNISYTLFSVERLGEDSELMNTVLRATSLMRKLPDKTTCEPDSTAIWWLVQSEGGIVPSMELETLQMRYALAVLFTSWKGLNWKRNTYWLSSRSVCEWEGITCDANRVVGISLSGQRLRGKSGVPTDLVWLSSLELFDVSENDLEGWLPRQEQLPVSLIHLNLSNNRFRGNLPRSWVNLTQLQYLNVSNNPDVNGSIPDEWAAWESLRILDLVGTKAENGSRVPEELCNIMDQAQPREITVDCETVMCSCCSNC